MENGSLVMFLIEFYHILLGRSNESLYVVSDAKKG